MQPRPPWQIVAKHIPMRRELKVFWSNHTTLMVLSVAKHIPMRRELKEHHTDRCINKAHTGRKAHPDEKGTESGWWKQTRG